MGYGSYHNDVREAQREVSITRESTRAFDYSVRASENRTTAGVHADLNIFGKSRESRDSGDHPRSTPIVVAMDVTSSRGKDAKAIYEQVPSFLASLRLSGVVPDPQIMWAAFGDANSDRAPIQIGQFESDRKIDDQLSKIWMEEGGGGTGEESSELLAYYLAHKTELDCLKRSKKGFVFFTSDEAPYPLVSKHFVKTHIGDTPSKDIPTETVFKALTKKYNTFLIFPRSSMEERKVAIDSEIKQRLDQAGGRYKDVDIRASLVWWSRDDLDLHCTTPSGEHIFYHSKVAQCGGNLDVDQNVRGENPKPVENIRWAKGSARRGTYKFWVELFAYHERRGEPVPFRAEIDIDGEIQTVEGTIPANAVGDRGRTAVIEFTYTPGAKARSEKDATAAYRDDVILEKWARYIPASHILRIQDPASAVEVMLGALALQSGSMTLSAFAENMKTRKVPAKRREDVELALAEFAKAEILAEVDEDTFK